MRYRVLRAFVHACQLRRPGEVIELDRESAGPRLRTGLIMQDKSLDGASETKVGTPPIKRKRKARR